MITIHNHPDAKVVIRDRMAEFFNIDIYELDGDLSRALKKLHQDGEKWNEALARVIEAGVAAVLEAGE